MGRPAVWKDLFWALDAQPNVAYLMQQAVRAPMTVRLELLRPSLRARCAPRSPTNCPARPLLAACARPVITTPLVRHQFTAQIRDSRMTQPHRGPWLGVAMLVSLLAAGQVWAQDAVVHGKVTDDRGEALSVANVQLVELNVAVLTGTNGQYTILVPAARVSGQTVTIRVRTIGHKPTTRPIVLSAGEQTQDFSLVTDVNQLEAVVVTGVQEATERIKVPFSVTTIDASKLQVPAADPLTLLQGKLPANIVSASGRPGAQPAVLLRGPTSLNAQGRSQDPLYIVDGVIINGALPDLNPSDIESVEVVKGAAAASLYGARGGNGVINITTRSGRRAGEGVQLGLRNEA